MLEFPPLLKKLNQREITIRILCSLGRRIVRRREEDARDDRSDAEKPHFCPAKRAIEVAPHIDLLAIERNASDGNKGKNYSTLRCWSER
jgi:hypothetical protein